jgi:ubiquinone/menaquinone biosynthesis C-methylase UbiE
MGEEKLNSDRVSVGGTNFGPQPLFLGLFMVPAHKGMLAIDSSAPADAGLEGRVSFTAGNVGSLPFSDRNFSACNVAFRIRAEPRIDITLFRVLWPRNRFLRLEFCSLNRPGGSDVSVSAC